MGMIGDIKDVTELLSIREPTWSNTQYLWALSILLASVTQKEGLIKGRTLATESETTRPGLWAV